jgi:hypothetical protein
MPPLSILANHGHDLVGRWRLANQPVVNSSLGSPQSLAAQGIRVRVIVEPPARGGHWDNPRDWLPVPGNQDFLQRLLDGRQQPGQLSLGLVNTDVDRHIDILV